MSEHAVDFVWHEPEEIDPPTVRIRLPREHNGHRIRLEFPDKVWCVTCDAPIPDPEPTEAPKTKVPTAGELAAGLRWWAHCPQNEPKPLPNMSLDDLLRAAAWRLTNTVLLVDTDQTLADAIESATGVPTFAVPEDTGVTEIVPDDEVVAYVLTIPEGARQPWSMYVAALAALGRVTDKPAFLTYDLKVEELSEDTMRRHGWVRAEEDAPPEGSLVAIAREVEKFRAMWVEGGGSFNPLEIGLPLPGGASVMQGFLRASLYFGEDAAREAKRVMLENEAAADPDPEAEQSPEPLEPGVQWDHHTGGIDLRRTDEGGLEFVVDAAFTDGSSILNFPVAPGAAEHIIDVLSRWLPTQPDWTAPEDTLAPKPVVAVCDHCGQLILLENGRVPDHTRSGSSNNRCPLSGTRPVKAKPGRVG